VNVREEKGRERNRRMNNEEERERYPAINFVIEDRENSGINATFDLKPVTAIKQKSPLRKV